MVPALMTLHSATLGNVWVYLGVNLLVQEIHRLIRQRVRGGERGCGE